MSQTLLSILAGLGGMFGWGVSDFFANIASEKLGHSKTVFWSQLAGMLFLGLLMFFVASGFTLTPSLLGLFVISSICYTVGYVYFYKAFEIGNVSVVSATINLNVVVGMAIAFIFKGQRLEGYQPLAIFLILLGVTLVSLNLKDIFNSKVSLLAGVKETIIASVVFGAFWNFSESLSEQTGWLPTAFWVKVISLLLLLVWSLLQKESLKYEKKKLGLLPMVALVGILEAGAVASVNFGLTVGDLVLVSPISSALSVVTITLAVIFLKEKLSKIQVLGILTAISGIILSAF